jgi:hypothetical protein
MTVQELNFLGVFILWYLAKNFGSQNGSNTAECQWFARLVKLQNNSLHIRINHHVGTLADIIGTRMYS